MRAIKVLFSLLTCVVFLTVAMPATAKEPSTTVYITIQPDYPFQDFGSYGTKKPVAQAGVTYDSRKCAYADLWTSTELSLRGPYGSRGYGDEIDLTLGCHGATKSPIGTLEYDGAVVGYLFSDFGRLKDDMVEIHADVGRPFQLGKVRVTPFVRGIQIWGLGELADLTFLRTGVRVGVPVTKKLSLDLEGAWVREFQFGNNVTRGHAFLRYDLGRGWSVSVGGKYTNNKYEPAIVSPAVGVSKTTTF